jgi:alpha-tubulin suppressor-like RCC1 family protein
MASRHRPRLLLFLVVAAALTAAGAAVAAAAVLYVGAPPGPTSVAAGGADSLLVKADGTLWAWGANVYGELGLGDTTPRSVPAQVGGDADWKAVAAGPNRFVKFAVKQDGTLWTWGDNEAYFLSQGAGDPPKLAPTQVGSDKDWTTVAVGSEFALALKDDGTLWAWGDNSYGQLGLGDTARRTTFTQVGTATDWAAIACGRDHSLALKTDKSLWTWGAGSSGQLGLGGTADADTPQQVAGLWKTIGCGTLHTLAVKGDGTLWAWGDNYFGALGQGDWGPDKGRVSPVQVGSDTDWVAVDGGEWHSIALKTDGTLWGWGDNGYGALGVGLENHEIGKTVTASPVQLDAATDWAAASCGDLYTLAVKQDGAFFAWGYNGYGQIGVGYPLARCTPEQVGSVGGWMSVAGGTSWGVGVRDDGTLWGWGQAPGLPASTVLPARAPVQIGATRDWAKVYAGRLSVMALKKDGSLWAWGANENGQLGLGDTAMHADPTRVGSSTSWAAVAIGSAAVDGGTHTLALKTDGSLWAWGSNGKGQLGLGDSIERHAPVRVGSASDWASAAAGGQCSFAVKTGGELYAWGKNASGELGLGDTGLEPNQPTRVGTASDWKQVSAADDAGQVGATQTATNFVVAVKTDGTLWSWGDGDAWCLGLPNGQIFDHVSPTQVGSDADWESVTCGDEISAGHVLALKADHSLWAWGKNAAGALGTGDYRWRFEPVQVGAGLDWASTACSDASYALKQDGTLWSWGPDNEMQLALGDPLWHPEPVDLVLTTEGDTTVPEVSVTPVPEMTGSTLAATAARVTRSAETAPSALGHTAEFRGAAAGWYKTPVTVWFSASDAGWGVSRTQYTLNGGISWLAAAKVTFKTNGRRTVTYNAVDRARNRAVPQSIAVNVDMVRPVPKALNSPVVTRGAYVTLKYTVVDKWSPTCAVKIVIKTKAGKTIGRPLVLGQKVTGRTFSTRIRASWARGQYKWLVYATDLAGNYQKTPGVKWVTVR